MGFGVPPIPDFWLGPLTDDATGWREDHIAFTAPEPRRGPGLLRRRGRGGAEVLHEPQEWDYHPGYYGAFVRDPDGNNVEAVCHVPE